MPRSWRFCHTRRQSLWRPLDRLSWGKMKQPGRTPGRPHSAWTQRLWWPALGLTWRQLWSLWLTGPCSVLCCLPHLWTSTWYQHIPCNPPLTNLAHDVTEQVVEVGTCLPRIVGACHNLHCCRLHSVMLYLVKVGLVTLEMKAVFLREAQCPTIIVPFLAAVYRLCRDRDYMVYSPLYTSN